MRDIKVSTGVFARIWSLRAEGEDTENAILQRVLWESSSSGPSTSLLLSSSKHSGGLHDQRFGVTFREGFQIERSYLGREYRASVQNGQWVIEGVPGRFSKLNELSRAIGTKTENAWANWFYNDGSGRRRQVSDLRNPEAISSRKTGASKQPSSAESPDTREERIRWCDDVKAALTQLGGRAPLNAIYKEVRKIRRANGRSVPTSLEETIRRTLEDYSSDSKNYRAEDWFEMAEGKGNGVWALRSR